MFSIPVAFTSPETPYKRGVVRKRTDRLKMQGWNCPDCETVILLILFYAINNQFLISEFKRFDIFFTVFTFLNFYV